MTDRRVVRAALVGGVLVPVLYFGIQLIRGLVVDGYSFRRDAASDLGADGVAGAGWFNLAAILCGVAAIVAALGWAWALQPWGVSPFRRLALVVAVVSIGAASIAAGAFPLPDDRHGGGPLGVGLFLFPALLVVATARSTAPRWVKVYAVGNLLLFVIAALMFSGATWLDPQDDAGIMQRVLAAAVFLPIGVVSWSWLRGSMGSGNFVSGEIISDDHGT